jgi:hypothetical protein
MTDSHPYISGPGNIAKMVNHLRKSFPGTVTSATVKKLGIASKNESYVINALQFIGIIDEDGNKSDSANAAFLKHKDSEFQKAFGLIVKSAYSALFELHGEDSWSLEIDELITFFRQTDQTSAAIGRRQANTFRIFAGLAGHGELPTERPASKKTNNEKPKQPKNQQKGKQKPPKVELPANDNPKGKDFALTVRIEINLPAEGSKETYDNIFKSIKENLMDG